MLASSMGIRELARVAGSCTRLVLRRRKPLTATIARRLKSYSR